MSPRILVVAAFVVGAQPLLAQAAAVPATQVSLPQHIANDMLTLFGSHPGYRITHAKGMVVTGTFTPSPEAATLSRAAHFKAPTQVTARFSDGTGIPTIPDASPNAAPWGFAVRFMLPNGAFTDIVANSHNGFVVGTGEDFAAFLDAVIATKPQSPHPTPVEKFVSTHPNALKFVTDPKPNPVSFADLSNYGNNAFIFVNTQGAKQAIRYQIVPVETPKFLDSATAAKEPPNYLFTELAHHLAKTPIKFRLLAQLASPGDQTKDGSSIWPDSRKTVELGIITLTTVAPNNLALQKQLAFNPIYLTDGIQLSDDPLPEIRSAVYALSVARRR
jgi:catalase